MKTPTQRALRKLDDAIERARICAERATWPFTGLYAIGKSVGREIRPVPKDALELERNLTEAVKQLEAARADLFEEG